jgi:hypothetical protein
MSMAENQKALEIANRFIEMEYEIQACRVVLSRFWRESEPWEGFVQKGMGQLRDRETKERGMHYLELFFREAKDDGDLLQMLHQETLGRPDVPLGRLT